MGEDAVNASAIGFIMQPSRTGVRTSAAIGAQKLGHPVPESIDVIFRARGG